MVAVNSALAWILVVANDAIRRAAEALDRIAEAEAELEEAQAAYERTLCLVRVVPDEAYEQQNDPSVVPLTFEGQVVLSLVCHRAALEASEKYGFDLRRAMEYGFKQWAKGIDGRRYIRYAGRKLRRGRS